MGMKPRAGRDRLGQAIDNYLTVQKRRGIGIGSLAAYHRVLGDFHAYAREQGCAGPDDVSADVVRGFHDMLLASGRASGTAHNAERIVSGFLKRLVEWEKVEGDSLSELFGGRQPGNKRMIAEELREVEALGVRMSIPGMSAAGHKTLLNRAVRIYGTWGKACKAAGVKRVPPGRPAS